MEDQKEEKKSLLDDDEQLQQVEKSKQSKTREIGMIVVLLFLQFGSLCVDTLIFPFFPKIAKDKGLSYTEIGVVFASYDLARFLAFPMAGSILLKWQPKSMCATGNIVTSLACVCFGFLKLTDNNRLFLGLCILVRVTAGVGSAFLTVSATSILMKCSSYTPSTIVGLMETIIGLGYFLGPAIGAALFNFTGYTPMFWIVGGVLLSGLPLFIWIVPQVVETKKQTKNFKDLLSIPGCFLMLVHCTVLKNGGNARATGISNWLISTFHMSPSYVALFYGGRSVFYVLTCPIATKLTKKGYIYQQLVVGWFLIGVLSLLFGPSALLDFIFHGEKNFWMMAVVTTLIMITQCFLYIPPFQAAMNLAEVNGHSKDSLHTYGMVTALINGGISLGSTTGPVVGGLITDALDFNWTETISGFTEFAMGLLMVIYLLYMKITCQPLSPPQTLHALDDDAKKDSINRQITSACNERMNECMKNLTESTQLHKPQTHEQP